MCLQQRWLALAILALLCVPVIGYGQEKDKAKPVLTVIDNNGKEHKLSSWTFTEGTKTLPWLADKQHPKGVEVLEFSEGKGVPLKTRVLTWVPLKHIRSLTFDNEKSTVTLRIAKSDVTDLVMEGVTGYVGCNVLAIEAEADFGDFGKAEVKFKGGVPRGIKKIIFPGAVPVSSAKAKLSAKITASDKAKTVHEVTNPIPVYVGDKQALVLDNELRFQKTIKIGLDKLKSLTLVGNGSARDGLVFDVALPSGQQKPLVLIQRRINAKKRPEFLLGLIAETQTGYKLFPMQVIAEAQFMKQE